MICVFINFVSKSSDMVQFKKNEIIAQLQEGNNRAKIKSIEIRELHAQNNRPIIIKQDNKVFKLYIDGSLEQINL